MPNFDYIKALDVQEGQTAEYTFFRIAGGAKLTVVHAGSTTPEFLSAVLKKSKVAAHRLRARKDQQLTRADMEATRVEDAELFARYIVKGWENVQESNGSECEFTEENCLEFLKAIPLDMFDQFRQFCLNIENFRPTHVDVMDPQEKEELQGN